MTTTLTPPAVADKARRLVVASERQSYDPFTDVDWSVPITDDAFHLPPEFLPLYGTAVWDSMSEVQRHTYSRHETASLCSAGIWFENILMRLIIDHLYELPADDGSHRYLLVETADECRHSAMFGEYIRQAGTPAYTVKKPLLFGGKFLKATTKGPEAYIAMLAAEELLDVCNRATMKDERVHATSRRIAKVHVMEEARHVSYARAYVQEVWPTLSWFRRVLAMVRMPFVVSAITDALVNPQVYDELGIEGGVTMARRNPHHRRRVVRDLAKLTSFLEEIGVINTVTRPLWRGLGLVAARDERTGAAGAASSAVDAAVDAAGNVAGAVGRTVVDAVAGRSAGVASDLVGRGIAAVAVVSTAWNLAGGSTGFRLS